MSPPGQRARPDLEPEHPRDPAAAARFEVSGLNVVKALLRRHWVRGTFSRCGEWWSGNVDGTEARLMNTVLRRGDRTVPRLLQSGSPVPPSERYPCRILAGVNFLRGTRPRDISWSPVPKNRTRVLVDAAGFHR